MSALGWMWCDGGQRDAHIYVSLLKMKVAARDKREGVSERNGDEDEN